MYNKDYRQVNGLVNENIILKQLHSIYLEKALLQPCRYDHLSRPGIEVIMLINHNWPVNAFTFTFLLQNRNLTASFSDISFSQT